MFTSRESIYVNATPARGLPASASSARRKRKVSSSGKDELRDIGELEPQTGNFPAFENREG